MIKLLVIEDQVTIDMVMVLLTWLLMLMNKLVYTWLSMFK